MKDKRIKLYPDGMDLTTMLYGTKAQEQEDILEFCNLQQEPKIFIPKTIWFKQRIRLNTETAYNN